MTYPCDPMRPFLGCASCAYSGGETPAAATASDARTGVKCATIEAAPEQCANTAEGLTHSDLTGKG